MPLPQRPLNYDRRVNPVSGKPREIMSTLQGYVGSELEAPLNPRYGQGQQQGRGYQQPVQQPIRSHTLQDLQNQGQGATPFDVGTVSGGEQPLFTDEVEGMRGLADQGLQFPMKKAFAGNMQTAQARGILDKDDIHRYTRDFKEIEGGGVEIAPFMKDQYLKNMSAKVRQQYDQIMATRQAEGATDQADKAAERRHASLEKRFPGQFELVPGQDGNLTIQKMEAVEDKPYELPKNLNAYRTARDIADSPVSENNTAKQIANAKSDMETMLARDPDLKAYIEGSQQGAEQQVAPPPEVVASIQRDARTLFAIENPTPEQIQKRSDILRKANEQGIPVFRGTASFGDRNFEFGEGGLAETTQGTPAGNVATPVSERRGPTGQQPPVGPPIEQGALPEGIVEASKTEVAGQEVLVFTEAGQKYMEVGDQRWAKSPKSGKWITVGASKAANERLYKKNIAAIKRPFEEAAENIGISARAVKSVAGKAKAGAVRVKDRIAAELKGPEAATLTKKEREAAKKVLSKLSKKS